MEFSIRQLADALPQVVWTAGPDGRLEYCNRRWYELTGFAETDQTSERSWTAVLHPEDVGRTSSAWRASLHSGQPFQAEYRFLDRRTGQYRWHLGRALPVRAEAGQIVRWFGTSTDIHDQKLAEQALRRHEERLRAALAASGTGTFRWDLRNNALECDDSLERLFGLPPGRKLDHLDELTYIIHPEDRAGVQEDLARCARDSSDFARDFRVVWPDGGIHWLAGRGKTFPDATGRPRAMTGACVDITTHKHLEEALRDADRRKDEFLAMLAHELRNPLAPLRNALHILQITDKNAGQRELRAMMERQLGQLVRLVDDLLDVSRISRGKIELRRLRLDVAGVVQSAVETSRPLLEAARHTLTVRLPEEPLYVQGDPVRLAQVLANLLNNSGKYTPEGGAIEISAERAGDDVVLRVRDNGVGIPPEMLTHVFEMFAQVDSARSRAQGGLGLGLTLVRRLVEMHGGSVRAHSEGPGTGATFSVHLPLVRPEPERHNDREHAPAPAMTRSSTALRVLVVDDNVDVAQSLGQVLKLMGHQVELAHDGLHALEVAQASPPDAVLLDIGLPGMSGYDVARRLRQLPRLNDVLLIAQTGWGQEEDQRRARAAGFDHHLTKPVDPEVLRRLLAAPRPART